MEAKELRIGNWVNHLDNWSYRQPKKDFKEFYFKWDESDFYALGECTLNLEDVQPIPLTEEILLKCGFVQCENEYWYTNGILDLSLPIGTFCINGSKNSEAVIRINPIKHLHQLQNLYFALTNKELTVNL